MRPTAPFSFNGWNRAGQFWQDMRVIKHSGLELKCGLILKETIPLVLLDFLPPIPTNGIDDRVLGSRKACARRSEISEISDP